LFCCREISAFARPNYDEKIGRDLYRAGVRRRSCRRMSLDQRVEPLRVGAELIEKRCAIDANNIHDARRE
jgi:uncharacterized protein (DUF111 family)